MSATGEELTINVEGKECIVNMLSSTSPEKRMILSLTSDTKKRLITGRDDVISSPASPSTIILNKLHGKNTISKMTEQTYVNDRSKMVRTVSNTALLRSLNPPPLIPFQFQTHPMKNPSTVRKSKLFLRTSVESDTKKTISIMTTATSASNLSTVISNHANRSGIYRKPVTTKATASIGNCIQSNTIDLTASNSASTNNQYPCDSTTDKANIRYQLEQREERGQDNSFTVSTVATESRASNEWLNVNGLLLPTSIKQQLELQYKKLNTITGNDHFPHVKRALQAFSEWVSNKCQLKKHSHVLFVRNLLVCA